jgi:hypothetical protein
MYYKLLLLSLLLAWTVPSMAQIPGSSTKVTVLNQACNGACNGKIRVDIDPGVIRPLEIIITKEGAGEVNGQYNVTATSTEFSELCVGKYKVTLKSSKIATCASTNLEFEIKSWFYGVSTAQFKNPSSNTSNDGRIQVFTYIKDQAGRILNYAVPSTFQWSNGSTGNTVQNLGVGQHTVTVTPNGASNCPLIANYTMSACNNETNIGEIQIVGGIFNQGQTESLISVVYRKDNTQPFREPPNDLVIEWVLNGLVVGNNASFNLLSSQVGQDVSVRLRNGCGKVLQAKKVIIDCNSSAELLQKHFIVDMTKPCIGHADGAVTIEFYPPRGLGEGADAKVYLNGGFGPELVFDYSKNLDFPYSGENYRVKIPSLYGNKNYTLTFNFGPGCKYEFVFKVPERETEKICAGFDRQNELCLYNEKCDGVDFGPEKNYSVKMHHSNKDGISIRAWVEDGLFPLCRKDLFCKCGDTEVLAKVGGEAWNTTTIAQWTEILFDFFKNGHSDIPESQIDAEIKRIIGDRDPCGHVRFCSLDPTVWQVFWNLNEKKSKKRPEVPINDDCRVITCTGPLPFLTRKIVVCGTKIDFNIKPKTDGTRFCEPRTVNLLQMVIWHQNGSLKTLFPGPRKELKYEGSELEKFLKTFSLTNKRLRCATVTFCKNDLNARPVSDEKGDLCGNIFIDSRGIPRRSCDIASLKIANEWYGDASSDQSRENRYSTYLTALQTAVFYCNNPANYSRVSFDLPPSFLWDLTPSTTLTDTETNGQSSELSSFSFEDEPEVFQNYQVFIKDSVAHEKLLDFGELRFRGRRIPKGLMTSAQGVKIMDYVLGNQTLVKRKASQISHYAADWDRDVTLISFKDSVAATFQYEYLDTLIQYNGKLSSNDFVKPMVFQTLDTNIIISGLFKGNLKIDSIDIVQSSFLSAFFLKISRQGVPLGFQMIEKIDTLQGYAWSELKAGILALVTGFDQGSLRLGGGVHTMNYPQGLVVAKMNEASVQIVKQVKTTAPVKVKGIGFSEDTTQIGLLILGMDTITQTAQGLEGNPINKLALVSLSSGGALKWSKHLPVNHLNIQKMGLSNGINKGLFLGLTYRDSFEVSQQKFVSKGNTDVLIVKYDTTGNVILAESHGSVDEETVSHLMDTEHFLFFGGEMNGSTKFRKMGLSDYINQTAYEDRVYISAIVDTIGAVFEIPDTTLVPTTVNSIDQKPSMKVDTRPKEYSSTIFAFPNPFQDELTLQFQAPQNSKWTLRILDNLGAVVKQIGQDVISGFNSVKLSTSTLQPGIYFLQCINADGYLLQTLKVVKM